MESVMMMSSKSSVVVLSDQNNHHQASESSSCSSTTMQNGFLQRTCSAKSERFECRTDSTVVDESSTTDNSELLLWCCRSDEDNNNKLPLKGCLKLKTHKDSLFQPYGASKDVQRNNSNNKKTVQWSCVDVYSHIYILGDHPDTRLGPPLTISWKADDHEHLSIDDFENNHIRMPLFKQNGVQSPMWSRQLLLDDGGYTSHELEQAIADAKRICLNREISRQDPSLLIRIMCLSLTRSTKTRTTMTTEKSSSRSMRLKDTIPAMALFTDFRKTARRQPTNTPKS